jgi:aminoglycoside phosphotransferase (APT) family kinase protein
MRVISPSLLERIVGRRVTSAEPLAGGYRNSTFKLLVEGLADPLVLRVYEHDPALCQKEVDILRLIAGSVPAAEVVDAAPSGLDDFPPFLLARHIDGISLSELYRHGDEDAIAQAAHSAGATLAAIGRFTFSETGWIAPGLTVTRPLIEGTDPVPRFIDQCLDSPVLQARMPADVRERTSAMIWSHAGEIAALDVERRLAHADYNERNLLVREVGGRWQVAAVLDWEFAVSGSPLMDIGNFLRYDVGRTEAPFARGYLEEGGVLPPDWRRLAQWIDLTALCAFLVEPATPGSIVAHVVDRIARTV